MSNTYVIELRPKSGGITVQAGIVVRDGRRFCFYAATPAFEALAGQLFRNTRAAQSAALRHISGRGAAVRSGAAKSRSGYRTRVVC